MALKVYYLNVGQGDSTYLQIPDGNGGYKHMLIDIHLHMDVGIDVVRFLEDYLPEDPADGRPALDYLVITHPHKDHITGIGKLHERIFIREMWEIEHDNPHGWGDLYDEYVSVREDIRERDAEAIKTPKASRYPIVIGEADVFVYSPSKYVEIDSDMSDEQIEALMHRRCMVLRVEYSSNAILFTGDSDKETWQKITPIYSQADVDGKTVNLLASDILHASHHGSRTFHKLDENDDEPYLESMDAIDPKVVIISVAAENQYDHPHPDALEMYETHVGKDNIHHTDENLTIICETDSNGEFSLVHDSGTIQDTYQLTSDDEDPDDDKKQPKQSGVTVGKSRTRLDEKPMA